MKKGMCINVLVVLLSLGVITSVFGYGFQYGPWLGKKCNVLIKDKKGKKVACGANYIHTGVDILGTTKDPIKNKSVYFTKAGTVKKVHYMAGWKYCVVIQTPDNKTFTIWHLGSVNVKENDTIKPGTCIQIGKVADLNNYMDSPNHIHLSQRNASYDSSNSGAISMAGRLRSCDHTDMDDKRLPKFSEGKFVQPDQSAIVIGK